MRNWLIFFVLIAIASCKSFSNSNNIKFETLDTDFSKGRLTQQHILSINDIEKFHGHLCDGLVLGTLAMRQAMKELYGSEPIDRTNIRLVSKPSPCLTDVAIYFTGARFQFNTFYVDTNFKGLYLIQRLDNHKTVAVSLNQGVKPTAIDSLGALAENNQLSGCGLDSLKTIENNFIQYLYRVDPNKIFTVIQIENFKWQPVLKNFSKTDILNKNKPTCTQK